MKRFPGVFGDQRVTDCGSVFLTLSAVVRQMRSWVRPGLRTVFIAGLLPAGLVVRTAAAAETPAQPSVPASPRVQQAVDRLRDQLRRGDQEAVDTFRQLRSAEAGLLVRDSQPGRYLPLHRVLADLFRRLSPSQQDVVRRVSGRDANRRLLQIVRSGRWTDLPEFLLKFSGTGAARRARLLLAQIHLARGRTLAARCWLADLPRDAVTRSLIQRTKRFRKAPSSSSASSPPHSTAAGDAPEPSSTWRVRWQHRDAVGRFPRDEAGRRTSGGKGGPVPMGSWNAVLRNGRLNRRTLHGLTALDCRTGKIQWAFRLRPAHVDFLAEQAAAEGPDRQGPAGFDGRFQESLISSGVLSQIAVAEDAVIAVTVPSSMQAGGAAIRQNAPPAPESRLVAVSRQDGRRLWTVGGPSLEPALDTPLSACWITGVPAADGRILHCIAERQNEIHLVSLRTRTGEVLHDSLLCFPDHPITRDVSRRRVAATPTIHEGILLCPTGTGWVLAVDSLTRSVLWATQTGLPAASRRSNEPFVSMPLLQRSGRLLPRQTELHVFDSLVVAVSCLSRGVCFMDAVTGELRERWQPTVQRAVVGTVRDGLLLYDPERRELLRVVAATGQIRWQRVLSDDSGWPAGPGTVRGSRLFLATSTGTLLVLDTDTGQTMRAVESLVPPVTAASLMPAGEDLILITPHRTVCLTQEPVSHAASPPPEQIARMLHCGAVMEAWERLSAVPSEEFRRSPRLKTLRFEAAFRLLQAGRLPPDIDPQNLAATEDQKLMIRALQIRQKVSEDPVAAVTEAVRLAMNHSDSDLFLPVTLLQESSEQDRDSPVQVCVATWAAGIADRAVPPGSADGSAAADDLPEPLCRLPDSILRRVSHPKFAGCVLSRFLPAEDFDVAVDGLTQAAELLHSSGGRDTDWFTKTFRLADWPSWKRLMDQSRTASSPESRVTALRRMAADVSRQVFGRADVLLPDVRETVAAAGSVPPQDAGGEEWTDDAPDAVRRVLVPFSHPSSPSFRVRRQLYVPRAWTDAAGDPWKYVFDPSPARLSVLGTGNVRLWSIPTAASAGPAATVGIVDRIGSIVLIPGPGSLTAVSLAGQRSLWHAKHLLSPETLAERTSVPSAGFLQDNHVHPRLERQVCRPAGIVGRTACLTDALGIRLVDVLTGRTIWKYPTDGVSVVTSTEESVVALIDDIPFVLDRATGCRRPCGLSAEEVRSIIRTQADQVVTVQGTNGDGKLQILWKHPSTGDVSRRIFLSNIVRLERMGETVLAAVAADRTIHRIALNDGTVQPLSWKPAERRSGVEPPDDAVWSASRLHPFECSGIVYVFLEPEQRSVHPPATGRLLTPFQAVRAVDRRTGRHLWETGTARNHAALAFTDQPDLPFLAVTERVRDPESGRFHDSVWFRCFHQRTGDPIIDARLPSRYSYAETGIVVETDGTVSVAIHGTHVRFERPDAPAVARPDSSSPDH